MIPISIHEFVQKFTKDNPGTDTASLTKALNGTVARKAQGAQCSCCAEPIWALGSAISNIDMCFTCLTGESNGSEDYEIDEVIC